MILLLFSTANTTTNHIGPDSLKSMDYGSLGIIDVYYYFYHMLINDHEKNAPNAVKKYLQKYLDIVNKIKNVLHIYEHSSWSRNPYF